MGFDSKTSEQIRGEFISALKEEGLILIPQEVGPAAISFYRKQQNLLKQTSVTPYQIANYGLIPGIRSLKTIMNWIGSGKISRDEWYKEGDKTYVLTEAINRLNNM